MRHEARGRWSLRAFAGPAAVVLALGALSGYRPAASGSSAATAERPDTAQPPAAGLPPVVFPPPVPLGLSPFVPIPADNPLTREKVELGERLFFDPILSRDRTVACASCHQPAHAFGDSSAVSSGISGRHGHRNAPVLVNRVYGASFFWDGRAPTLEDAVLMPVQDTMEMSMSLPDLIARVQQDPVYGALFQRAFPGEEISKLTVARALASYVRTLRSGDSPYDRFEAGDTTALSPAARRGLSLFFGRGDCARCHGGPNFTDERFHNTAVSDKDPGSFKTPTLRDVARSAPYMHDGSLATLEEVVNFYDQGGRGFGLRRLGLSEDEKADLVEFLRALSSTR